MTMVMMVCLFYLSFTIKLHLLQVFKLWGDPVNIREQQDAFDFFQALIDQIDEQLKVGTS